MNIVEELSVVSWYFGVVIPLEDQLIVQRIIDRFGENKGIFSDQTYQECDEHVLEFHRSRILAKTEEAWKQEKAESSEESSTILTELPGASRSPLASERLARSAHPISLDVIKVDLLSSKLKPKEEELEKFKSIVSRNGEKLVLLQPWYEALRKRLECWESANDVTNESEAYIVLLMSDLKEKEFWGCLASSIQVDMVGDAFSTVFELADKSAANMVYKHYRRTGEIVFNFTEKRDFSRYEVSSLRHIRLGYYKSHAEWIPGSEWVGVLTNGDTIAIWATKDRIYVAAAETHYEALRKIKLEDCDWFKNCIKTPNLSSDEMLKICKLRLYSPVEVCYPGHEEALCTSQNPSDC
jgi:hypothetical protein